MVSLKTSRSLRGIKSTLSVRAKKAYDDIPQDIKCFEDLVPMACNKFQCPFVVVVKRETQQDEYLKALKQDTPHRSRRISQVLAPPKSDSENSDFCFTAPMLTDNTLVINSIYNVFNSLLEILLSKLKEVPQMLIKIIGVIAPLYRTLAKISIKRCNINMNIIYELSKLLQVSTITDICLDGCPINNADYTLLLDTTKLKYLSLARCKIDDEICEQIALKIHHLQAAHNLAILNLSTNRISDVGAKTIGLALRTNRRLRYLNLADNHITDKGAAFIFDALIEFQLTQEEIMGARKAGITYLREKQQLCAKFLAQLDSDSTENISQISRKTLKRKKTSTTTLKSKTPTSSSRKDRDTAGQIDYLKTKAEFMAVDILGPYFHPFQKQYLKICESSKCCLGNLTLSYLNLAYNDLSYYSAKRLESIVIYQKLTKKPSQTGLIKIIIDGNNMPSSCPEFANINDLLRRTFRTRTISDFGVRKPRSKERAE